MKKNDQDNNKNNHEIKASDVFVRCLENEGVEYIFWCSW